jgi:thiosulfate/3-mercaptopyruvate sulfurtransferase
MEGFSRMSRLRTTAALACAASGAQAASAQPLVSAEWLAEHLGDSQVVVLDIRPSAEHESGHVPSAVSAEFGKAGWQVARPDGAVGALPPVDRLAETIGALGVGDDARVVIVGKDFPGAARVYWTFKVLGHDAVSVLDGGWGAWTGPVERGPVQPRPATFTPRYDAALRAELPEVTAAVADGSEKLVDARPQAQWQGTAKSPVVRAYGHLPGAIWVDQRAALAPDGRLKPKEALQSLFAEVGNKPAIAYCNAGYLAAADWFVLSEVLHHQGAKLYDGSLSEWTADPSRPVAR